MVACPAGNRILDSLTPEQSEPLLARGKLVSLRQGQVVFQQDGPIPKVYFPTTCVFGIILVLDDGRQVEAATVGNWGLIGLPLFLGVDRHPFRAVVEVSGQACQVAAASFLQAARLGSALDALLRRYTLYRLRCADQTGACNALHPVQERLARWLLIAHDRAGSDEFHITHEFLALLLGVTRQTVSTMAAALQAARLITYHRGRLRILDREALERASCGCYQSLKHLYATIVGI
jgi:CRP-like cAMP-binding protein